ncbi:MAG: helix-turn-helix domain-containing protein [Geminicoccaceae bacterium]
MNASSKPRGRRRVTRYHDWHKAAEMLAEGLTITEAARRLPCARSTLSRKYNGDPVFRGWIEGFRGEEERDRKRLAELRHKVHEAIEAAIKAKNVRLIMWLAERLNLVRPPDARTPQDELRAMLSELSPDELREFESLGEPD